MRKVWCQAFWIWKQFFFILPDLLNMLSVFFYCLKENVLHFYAADIWAKSFYKFRSERKFSKLHLLPFILDIKTLGLIISFWWFSSTPFGLPFVYQFNTTRDGDIPKDEPRGVYFLTQLTQRFWEDPQTPNTLSMYS